MVGFGVEYHYFACDDRAPNTSATSSLNATETRMRTLIASAALLAGFLLSLADIPLTDAWAAGAVNNAAAAPVVHRQPVAKDRADDDETSAEKSARKMDAVLDRKLKSICRGC